MNCTNCGAPIPPNSPRCRKCGASVEQAPPPSGSGPPPATPGVQVIVQTGTPGAVIPGPPVGPAVKSKVVAGVLGILLGALGVHRFYLGYTSIGLSQLLLTVLVGPFTCGISAMVAALWGVIEGIMILVGGIDRDAFNRPLTG